MNKHIMATLHVKPQIVYNMRYMMGKKKGLGALPVKTTAPAREVYGVVAPKPTLWEKVVAFFN